MCKKYVSLREWQKMYKKGDFKDSSFETVCKAGWYDWFCDRASLPNRLKKIALVVMGITCPELLDNYYVWFKNNCPCAGPLYDDVRFEPLGDQERDGRYFVITRGDKREEKLWVLFTERSGFDRPEYQCDNVRKMIKYLNEQGSSIWNKTEAPVSSQIA